MRADLIPVALMARVKMPTLTSLLPAVLFGAATFTPVSAGESPCQSDQTLMAQRIARTSSIVVAECSQKDEALCRQEAQGCMKVCDGTEATQRPGCIQSCRNRYRQCKSECDDDP